MNRSSQIILGSVLYGLLALLYQLSFVREPTMKFVFNVALAIAGMVAGLIMKAVELRRSTDKFGDARWADGAHLDLNTPAQKRLRLPLGVRLLRRIVEKIPTDI